MTSLNVTFISRAHTRTETVAVDRVVIGGWTGRDKAAVQHHIDELAAIGVAPPAKTPMFYHVGAIGLTTADTIDVIGDGSSGEVEYVLLQHKGSLWVGAGSDHTDRVFEKHGITLAKQLCPKPVAAEFWPLDEVRDHWDQIVMQSHVVEDGRDVLYQDGTLGGLMAPDDLIRRLQQDGGSMSDGTLLFGGTTAARGGVRFNNSFRFALTDPVLDRKIEGHYRVNPLPITG